jgi:hypothetical protein
VIPAVDNFEKGVLMRKTAIALASAMAFAFVAPSAPADAATKDKPKTAKVLVKKADKKVVVARYKSKCKPGEKWNAAAGLQAGACEKRVVKVKVKAVPKAAEKPDEKPAVIKRTG